MKRKIKLGRVRVQSFMTCLEEIRQNTIQGGLQNLTVQVDCSNQSNCTDINRCGETGCCMPQEY